MTFVVSDIPVWEQFARSVQWPTAPRLGDAEGEVWKQEFDRLPAGTVAVTEAVWEALPWNPMIGEVFMDPDAGPKPPWQDVVLAYKAWTLMNSYAPGSFLAEEIDIVRDRMAFMLPSSAHVGAGIGRMEGISHLLNAAQLAGGKFPDVVFRDRITHEPLNFHTIAHTQEFVQTLAHRKNLVESAHNSIIGPFSLAKKIFQDEDAGVDERYAAGEAMQAFLAAYPTALQAEMHRLLASDGLCGDLTTARLQLQERLEAAATGHQKYLKGALTQQAIDNWAACVELGDALELVARQCALGSLEIQNATTIAEAKTAHQAAVDAIQRVTPINTPHWEIEHNVIAEAHPAERSLTASSVLLRGVQPAGKNVPGAVNTGVTLDGGVATTQVITGDPVSVKYLRVTLATGETNPVTITATARNLCGPSRLVVVLTPPAT